MITKPRAGDVEARNSRFANHGARKSRGGYYTPPALAKWICDWAIRTVHDRTLEPSCGDGVFIGAALAKFIELGASPAMAAARLQGIELDAAEACKATERFAVRSRGGLHTVPVENQDFFQWLWSASKPDKFTCVVGNPPFIRYQSFPEPSRSLAMKLMERFSLRPNRLTNIWVPFVVGSLSSLERGGRIGMVVPAELLQVNYAAQLRCLLVDSFDSIDIVSCNELLFEGAEQEVVVLLADGYRGGPVESKACKVNLHVFQNVTELLASKPGLVTKSAEYKYVQHDSEKWLKYFLSQIEIELMRDLRKSDLAAPLSRHAKVEVGVVTGNNGYFVLSREKARALSLEDYSIPLVGRSRHFQGSIFTAEDWEQLEKSGDNVLLLHINGQNGDRLTSGAKKYITLGEEQAVHLGYKCSIRNPWYTVPAVWAPDAFMFRQIYDFPRLILNETGAVSTDTIHRVKFYSDRNAVHSNMYTFLTAASAEIEGRSYGGGVLELEPREADNLLVPAAPQEGLQPAEIDRLVRTSKLQDLLEMNSKMILRQALGMSKTDCKRLKDIWAKLSNRRMARKRR